MRLEVSRLADYIEPLSGLDRQESVTLQRQMKFWQGQQGRRTMKDGGREGSTEFMVVQRAVNDVAIENKTRNNEFLSGLGMAKGRVVSSINRNMQAGRQCESEWERERRRERERGRERARTEQNQSQFE